MGFAKDTEVENSKIKFQGSGFIKDIQVGALFMPLNFIPKSTPKFGGVLLTPPI